MLMEMIGREGKMDDVVGEEVTLGEKSLWVREKGSRTQVERLNLGRSWHHSLLQGEKQDTWVEKQIGW